jgi:S-phase kinase-associated protein 1
LQEEKLKSSKKIKVMSYDGDVFKIDYDVALMSKTLQDVIESYPNIGDIEDSIILLSNVKSASSKILRKIIEYCKKHKDEEESHMMEDWDAEFIDLDLKTLINLFSASMYLNIKSLRYLACLKIIDMNKDKTFHEFCQTFEDSMTDL